MVSLSKMLLKVLFVIKVLVAVVSTIVAWYFFTNGEVYEQSTEEETPSESEDSSDEETPSVFIDQALLPLGAKSYASNDAPPFLFGKEYSIGGAVFTEKIEIEKFGLFEVYSNSVNMDNYADDVDMSGNDERVLEMYTQTVPHGVVINANVYINNQQWNTLVYVSGTTFTCSVCGVYCDETEHVKLDSHKINLNKHKPLYKYDLSITRKINDFYHCGVCNILFHKSVTDDHFSSKEHEDKMLFAINKVSDIMYDLSTENNKGHKNDTYHYSAKAINNNNLDLSSSEEESEDDRNDYNDDACGIKYDEDDDDQDDENFYDNVEPPLSLEHSYASMARRPKTDELPKVLEIDLGNKKVTVKYNSWNMVIRPKANRFYCMVCTTFGHVRNQAEHCRSLDHVERLAKCAVVDNYEMYLVRQVDDKLYHCGHCNNLQLIHEMEDHIESQHSANRHTTLDSPAKQAPSTPLKNYSKTSKPTTNSIARSIFNDKENSKIGVNDSSNINNELAVKSGILNNQNKNTNQLRNTNPPASIGTGNLNMYHDLRLANSTDDDLIICAYGKRVKITKMAYNIVCVRMDDFYCGLCEIKVDKTNIKQHINNLQHLILLQRTPFIEAFNIHLFRQIRDALHCALCNELIEIVPAVIISHKFDQKHVASLGGAMGLIPNNIVTPTPVKIAEKPINTANKTVNNAKVSPTKATVTPASDDKIVINNAVKNTVPNTTIAPNDSKTPVQIVKDKTVVHNDTAKVNTITVTPANDEIARPNVENSTEELNLENIVLTEFIEVKNGIKEDSDEETADSDDSTTEEFDREENIYVKLGNSYIKITNTSYNTLVEVGDGTKYCFVCAFGVDRELKKHVDSRTHMENMDKCKFVDKYKEDLLRQIYLMYHCGICNVLVTRKQLSQHLSWPTHILQTENTKISGKQRKTDIKSGMKQYTITTQKENIYLNESETKVKIFLNIAIQKENVVSVARKNKIVIFNDNVMKISFDSWHSLGEVAYGWKCKVCQCEFDAKEIANHVASDWHNGNLDKFERKYSPALIRKINDATLNCVMCNTELLNKKPLILEHIQGKKHKKSFDTILEESSVTNSYADCDEDVVTL